MTATTAAPSSIHDRRYKARGWLWGHSKNRRLSACGRIPIGGSVALMRYADGTVRAQGLEHCHSVWACPMCSASIVARRADRLAIMMERWRESGGHVALMTLTLGHTKGDALKDSWKVLQKAWQSVVCGSPWKQLAAEFGVPLRGAKGRVSTRLPYTRAVEVTVGEHGWHPHVHVLLWLPPSSDPAGMLDRIWSVVSATWLRSVERQGRRSSIAAQDCHMVAGESGAEAGRYLAKQVLGGTVPQSLAAELTSSQTKTGKRGSRTPWEVLEELAAGGLEAKERNRLKALWYEWEAASKGKRQMVQSQGLPEAMGLEEEDLDTPSQMDDADQWVPEGPGRKQNIMSDWVYPGMNLPNARYVPAFRASATPTIPISSVSSDPAAECRET